MPEHSLTTMWYIDIIQKWIPFAASVLNTNIYKYIKYEVVKRMNFQNLQKLQMEANIVWGIHF